MEFFSVLCMKNLDSMNTDILKMKDTLNLLKSDKEVDKNKENGKMIDDFSELIGEISTNVNEFEKVFAELKEFEKVKTKVQEMIINTRNDKERNNIFIEYKRFIELFDQIKDKKRNIEILEKLFGVKIFKFKEEFYSMINNKEFEKTFCELKEFEKVKTEVKQIMMIKKERGDEFKKNHTIIQYKKLEELFNQIKDKRKSIKVLEKVFKVKLFKEDLFSHGMIGHNEFEKLFSVLNELEKVKKKVKLIKEGNYSIMDIENILTEYKLFAKLLNQLKDNKKNIESLEMMFDSKIFNYKEEESLFDVKNFEKYNKFYEDYERNYVKFCSKIKKYTEKERTNIKAIAESVLDSEKKLLSNENEFTFYKDEIRKCVIDVVSIQPFLSIDEKSSVGMCKTRSNKNKNIEINQKKFYILFGEWKEVENQFYFSIEKIGGTFNPPKTKMKKRSNECETSMFSSVYFDQKKKTTLKQLHEYIKNPTILGRGTFGVVYEGVIPSTGQLIAVKEVDLSILEKKMEGFVKDKNELDQKMKLFKEKALQEISLLEKLDHKNIIKYFGSDVKGNFVVILTELASKGILSNAFSQFKTVKERVDECKPFFLQVVEGLSYLHENEIIHKDIKPQNILLNKNDIVKICDIGISKIMDEKEKQQEMTSIATFEYSPPEFKKYCQALNEFGTRNKKTLKKFKKIIMKAIDIYSLGVTFLQLLSGKYERIRYDEDMNPLFTDKLNDHNDIKQLIIKCVMYYPKDRPTAKQLLSMLHQEKD